MATTITVQDYRTDPDKRNLADIVLERGQVDKNQAHLIIEKTDYWEVSVYKLRAGKRYFWANGAMASEVKRVPKHPNDAPLS
jgi:hypothetical protein